MSLTKVSYSMIQGASANITDYGASTSNTGTQNATAIAAALATGLPVYVPNGTFECDPILMPSNSRLYGNGYESELKFTGSVPNHFVAVIDVSNVIIENLRINGNKTGTGFSNGSCVEISNTEDAFEPINNKVIVKNCWIEDAAFAAVGAVNSHNVLIDGNFITGSTDSGIAVTTGGSNWVIVNNNISGYSFQISLSSNGVTNLSTVGYTRQCTVSNNVCNNTKASGYGIELDGIANCVVTSNVINNNGGQYGIRLLPSFATGSTLDVYFTNVCNNIIYCEQDIVSAGIEIYGPGDLRNCQIANNTISTKTIPSSNVVGCNLAGGASITVDSFTIEGAVKAFNVDSSNVNGSIITIQNSKTLYCTIGVQADYSYANKAFLNIYNTQIISSTASYFSVGSAYYLTLKNTPVGSPSYISSTSYASDPIIQLFIIDPASIAPGGTWSYTATVSGAALGNWAQAAYNQSLSGLILTAYVSAANTVIAQFYNPTGGAIDLSADYLYIKVTSQ